TDTLEKFTAPKPFCAMSLGGDGALLLACETEGDAVPGCFQPSNNGPHPIYYRYIETYKRGMNDDHWTDPQIASDVHRRVRNTKAFADIEGSGFLVWGSDVPCGTGVAQLRVRIMPLKQSSPGCERLIDEFPPEEQPYG